GLRLLGHPLAFADALVRLTDRVDVDVELLLDLLQPLLGVLDGRLEVDELLARDVELPRQPRVGAAVALDLVELALELALGETRPPLWLGRPGFGLLHLGAKALGLLTDL